jgi:hypothetical protein
MTARLFVPGRTHVAERDAGAAAAEVAVLKIRRDPSDAELLTRAACRVLADAGYGFAAIPPAAFAAFMERVQRELQRECRP